MDDAVRKKLDQIRKGILAYPDLHTRSYSLGARMYDAPALIDGKTYYFQLSFDVHHATKKVTILTESAEEISGPH